jgi:hypothetical protein
VETYTLALGDGRRMLAVWDGRRYRCSVAGLQLGGFATLSGGLQAAAAVPAPWTEPPALRVRRRCPICGSPLLEGRCSSLLCQHYGLPVPIPDLY